MKKQFLLIGFFALSHLAAVSQQFDWIKTVYAASLILVHVAHTQVKQAKYITKVLRSIMCFRPRMDAIVW
jgi:hypothetical protein